MLFTFLSLFHTHRMASLEDSRINEGPSLLDDPKPSAEVDAELPVPGDENAEAGESGSSSQCKEYYM